MNAQQYLLREYLRLLWADSGFQQDWQSVRRGELDFACLEQRWRLPRTLRRLLLDASRESEEPTLQRLQEKIPALELSGFAIITPEGVMVEPETSEKPLQGLPQAEPSAETREAYLARVKLLLLQERNFANLLQQVEALPDVKQREAYLNALRGQEPKLLPEAQQRFPELAGHELELQVLLLAMRYYEACLQAIRPRLTPKRFRNRQLSEDYLQDVARMLYLRLVKQLPDVEIQMEIARRGEWRDTRVIIRECSYWLRELEFPPETLKRKRGRPKKSADS
ncbi:MAG: hypothetical protein P3X24_007435 [bacterium]|nr:hypothetical protein [bacterium]